LLIFLTFVEPERESTKKPLREKILSLDPLGTVIVMGCIVCLILALQWGGISRPWSDSNVWGCFLGFILTLVLFIALQIRQKER
jgi:MFS transporter, DHA2 family, glioxin efflux transporter